MSELQHTTPQANSPSQSTAKAASTATATTTATATARRVNPNQSHLGLKAFIISASVVGTVAGWGVLASNQIGASAQLNSPIQTNNSTNTSTNTPVLLAQNDASRWVLPEVLAQSDIPPRVDEFRSNDTRPKHNRTTARQLPPPAAATDVNRVRPSAAKTAQNSSTDAPINVQPTAQPTVQPTVREVNVLPTPIQQRQPQAVARSRSSR